MTIEAEYEYFLETACDALRVKCAEARSGERTRRAVYARRVIAICLRERGYSLPEISEAMGLKSHTTVLRLIAGQYRDLDTKADERGRAKQLATRLVAKAKRAEAVPVAKVQEPPPAEAKDRWHGEWLNAVRRLGKTFVEDRAEAWEHECRRLFPYSWQAQAAVLPRMGA